jgi:TonB family protein
MPAAIIGALHLAAVISLRVAVPSVATNDAPPVAVSYLDVPPPESPESPRAKVLQARPLVVAQSVIIPAAEGAVAHPDQAAGFQELLAPKNVPAVPPGELAGTEVREQDFSGRGIAGGVAGGKPPVALPDTMAARLAQQGEVSDAVTPVQRQHRERGYLDEEDVLVRPELRNVEDIRDALREYYPAVMRSAGIEGHVIIEFIVDSTGVVRPSSVRVIEASQPLFADAAIKVLRMAQFTPGRAEFGTRSVAVNVKVRVPLTWTMRHGTAPED